ncbi:MAG TPA: UDP-N-acetylglucosamine--N-acetylmuramyl-(pentapeptide) pyrophosphoryl-undecaprenol N-acetylglucosamine transferase, partial [Aggregatilineales bacterium]|nr:UDP-N-acetylglucosamine--N-acetylmuramyl-(pentapeptide) pyrophosphoryl-undecaprenol N-acetylglucosamine transferase [Aggregatilineales bacterium]
NGVGFVRAVLGAIKIVIGTAQAWLLVARIRPALLFLTGGWATFPVALACWLRRIPIAIFLPDVEPALAIKLLSRLAYVVLATTEESKRYFSDSTNVIATGYPLRSMILTANREAAIAHFGLEGNRKTLLVWGGSRGARSLNETLSAILPDLLSDGLQVLHVSGELDWPAVQQRAASLADTLKVHYHAFAYLHDDMGMALAAADLTVSRAGASILGEYPHFGLPSILVPYPFAWQYQKVNADWLASRGAAVCVPDSELGKALLPFVRTILGNAARLQDMHQRTALLSHPEAARDIARMLLKTTVGQ